jgi:cytochrome c oxidase cbb3-type subunit III
MSNGLSVYIAVLCAVNIFACVALLWWMRKRSHEEARTTDTTGHIWDGDLREYNNPLPRWWLWTFLLSIIFAVVYLVMYPGFGSNAGTLGWSSKNQFDEMQRKQEAQAQGILAQFNGKSAAELSQNPQAMQIARNIFANNCAACHGSDARGARGFPNLTDGDWLWGGSAETVEATIRNGRIGAMPGWGPVLGAKGVEDMVAYVMSLSGRTAPAGDATAGGAQFATLCVACHGADGKGNQLLGGPNLTDGVWLYGSGPDSLRTTITNGRQNQMPAHADRLGDLRVKLMTAYVLSLGSQNAATATP